jgi:hypothetical protein
LDPEELDQHYLKQLLLDRLQVGLVVVLVVVGRRRVAIRTPKERVQVDIRPEGEYRDGQVLLVLEAVLAVVVMVEQEEMFGNGHVILLLHFLVTVLSMMRTVILLHI